MLYKKDQAPTSLDDELSKVPNILEANALKGEFAVVCLRMSLHQFPITCLGTQIVSLIVFTCLTHNKKRDHAG